MNAAKVEPVQMSFDSQSVQKGDRVVVDGHSYPIGNGLMLHRRPGEYCITFVFNNGNVFAQPLTFNGMPQVIPPYYIMRKI